MERPPSIGVAGGGLCAIAGIMKNNEVSVYMIFVIFIVVFLVSDIFFKRHAELDSASTKP